MWPRHSWLGNQALFQLLSSNTLTLRLRSPPATSLSCQLLAQCKAFCHWHQHQLWRPTFYLSRLRCLDHQFRRLWVSWFHSTCFWYAALRLLTLLNFQFRIDLLFWIARLIVWYFIPPGFKSLLSFHFSRQWYTMSQYRGQCRRHTLSLLQVLVQPSGLTL